MHRNILSAYREQQRKLGVVQCTTKEQKGIAAVTTRLVEKRVKQRVAFHLNNDIVEQPDSVSA
jgi:hypothetical protein